MSSVSHELRTPVAQIRLYVDTLRLGRAPTRGAARSGRSAHIERETTRLSHLVENVLRFSTLGATDPTQREPVDVGAEVATIVDEFRPLAASRRANDRRRRDRQRRRSSLRPDALRHIVLNLLDNAVKYGPVGQTIRVRVRQRRIRSVAITVDDEGPGVPAERSRAHLAPVHARTRRRATNGGSGIGLTIVREVAEAHGGTARVDERTSRRRTLRRHAARRRGSRRSRYEHGRAFSSSKTTPISPPGIEYNLKLEGYDVRIADDGRAAIAAATEWKPDLVLLDLMLPGVDGYQRAAGDSRERATACR